MELELKDLVHYLPYKLKCQWHNGDVGILTQLHVCEKDTPYFGDFVMFVTADAAMTIESEMPAGCHQIKPILRPLYEIPVQIEHNGERFIPKNRIKKLFPNVNGWYQIDDDVWGGYHKNLAETIIEYCVIDILISWHFDVFGLIEKGLAIDMNIL